MTAPAASPPLRVLVWDENAAHVPAALYPQGIRGAIAAGLQSLDGDGRLAIRLGHLDQPDQGLAGLDRSDVLICWAHLRHDDLDDARADAIVSRCRHMGLGLIFLHSAHYAKPFRRVLGCSGDLRGGWREDEAPEMIRVCAPWHPIAAGVEDFTLAREEMYGAPFDVPAPDCLILQSHFPAGGESFPAGLAWSVGDGIDPGFGSGPGQGVGQGEGRGRVFYFRPGHETCPSYYHPAVQRILYNAVRWAGRS